jgi:hypothetical protein
LDLVARTGVAAVDGPGSIVGGATAVGMAGGDGRRPVGGGGVSGSGSSTDSAGALTGGCGFLPNHRDEEGPPGDGSPPAAVAGGILDDGSETTGGSGTTGGPDAPDGSDATLSGEVCAPRRGSESLPTHRGAGAPGSDSDHVGDDGAGTTGPGSGGGVGSTLPSG